MRLLRILSIVLLASTVAQAKDEATFRWSREVKLPVIEATTPVAAPLDAHFFQFTRDNWPDVRLKNEHGDVISYLVIPAQEMKTRTIRRFWPAEITSAKVDESAGLQIEIVLGPKEAVPSGIRIVTPLRDFEHQIQIDSSSDGKTWKSTGPAAIVFDYARYVDARNDLVPFQAGTDRHFRITILDPTAEQQSQFLELHRRLSGAEEIDRNERTIVARRPFRIDRIEFYRDNVSPETKESRTTIYPTTEFKQTDDTKHQQSMLSFSTNREPVTQIKVVTEAENFSRAASVQVEVENTDTKPMWRPISTGTLTRFAVGTIQRTELTLSIPEQRSHRYRVLIENRDSSPLVFTGVELHGPIYELTFLASPGQKIVLEYGSPDSSEGHYDTAALRESLGQLGTLPAATLEAPQENPNAKPDNFQKWTPWNDVRLLVGTIIALTGILGWGLYRAGQRVTNSMPPGDA